MKSIKVNLPHLSLSRNSSATNVADTDATHPIKRNVSDGPSRSLLAFTSSNSSLPKPRSNEARPRAASTGQSPTRVPPTPAFQESHVSQVSLRLGEAVNRVFLQNPALPALVRGRNTPQVSRATELAEMILTEIADARHDTYLLRTLVRSSILKACSLFVSRLTPLLVPAQPLPNLTTREWTLAPPIQFNLVVVRCAYTVKQALVDAGHLPNAPRWLAEILRPWVGKLEQVIASVMTPLLRDLKEQIARVCLRAWMTDYNVVVPGSTEVLGANGAGRAIGPAVAESTKAVATKPAPPAKAARTLPSLTKAATTGSFKAVPPAPEQGPYVPVWIRDLGTILDGAHRLLHRLDCGADAERWLAGIATYAIWKGMLNLSGRRIDVQKTQAAGPPVTSGIGTPLVGTAAAARKPRKPLSAGSDGEEPRSISRLMKLKPRSTSPADANVSPEASFTSLTALAPARRSDTSLSDDERPRTSCDALRLVYELQLFESRLAAFCRACGLDQKLTPPASPYLAEPGCALCALHRTFATRDDSDTEADDAAPPAPLAQYAVSEAMESLSAMIVVSKSLCFDTFDLVASMGDAAATNDSDAMVASTAASRSAAHGRRCETLRQALLAIPALILVHMLASRVPGIAMPQDLFTDGDWVAYTEELRTLSSAETAVDDIAWGMAESLRSNTDDETRVLKAALRIKAGVALA